MKCEQVWDLLSAYADKETTSDETAIVETHIAVCFACSRGLEFMKSTAGILSMTPEIQPPVSLHQAILAATVYRSTWQRRLQAAFGVGFAARAWRYSALAGTLAAAMWISIRVGGPVGPDPTADRSRPMLVAKRGPVPPLVVPSPDPSVLFTATIGDAMESPTGRENSSHVVESNGRPLNPSLGRQPVVAVPGKSNALTLAWADRNGAADPGKAKVALPKDSVNAEALEPSGDMMPVLSDHLPSTHSTAIARAETEKNNPMATLGVGETSSMPIVHIALASMTEYTPPTQLVTLADLKRSLRRQAMDDRARFVTESINEKRIRFDVVRGRF